MKKLICSLLCITLVFALAACGKKAEEEEGRLVAYKDTDGNVVTEYITLEQTENKGGSEEKDIEAPVEITVPLAIIDKKYHSEPEKFCKENSYISCQFDEEKQTATITMRSLTYSLNLTKVGIQIMGNIGTVVDSGEYPYVIKLDSYTENFDELVILVNGEEYEKAGDTSVLLESLGECGLFYQIYTTENKYSCTVKIKDEQSGKIIDEEQYRMDNSGKKY